jgi:hypothetical protein
MCYVDIAEQRGVVPLSMKRQSIRFSHYKQLASKNYEHHGRDSGYSKQDQLPALRNAARLTGYRMNYNQTGQQ